MPSLLFNEINHLFLSCRKTKATDMWQIMKNTLENRCRVVPEGRGLCYPMQNFTAIPTVIAAFNESTTLPRSRRNNRQLEKIQKSTFRTQSLTAIEMSRLLIPIEDQPPSSLTKAEKPINMPAKRYRPTRKRSYHKLSNLVGNITRTRTAVEMSRFVHHEEGSAPSPGTKVEH